MEKSIAHKNKKEKSKCCKFWQIIQFCFDLIAAKSDNEKKFFVCFLLHLKFITRNAKIAFSSSFSLSFLECIAFSLICYCHSLPLCLFYESFDVGTQLHCIEFEVLLNIFLLFLSLVIEKFNFHKRIFRGFFKKFLRARRWFFKSLKVSAKIGKISWELVRKLSSLKLKKLTGIN